jgi:hypothetical protein
MINWDDLAGRPQITCQLAICLRCGNTMIRRTPEGTYHRHIAAARAGLHPLTHCPKCGAALYARNLAN